MEVYILGSSADFYVDIYLGTIKIWNFPVWSVSELECGRYLYWYNPEVDSRQKNAKGS